MSFNLQRAIKEVLSIKAKEEEGESALISKIIGYLYFTDFEIMEQAATVGESYQTNIIGFKGDISKSGGLAIATNLSLPLHDEEKGIKENLFEEGIYCDTLQMANIVDFLLKCYVSSSFKKSDLKKPIIMCALFGTKNLSESLTILFQNKSFNPDAILFYEPANLKIVQAHPGAVRGLVILKSKKPFKLRAPAKGFFRIKSKVKISTNNIIDCLDEIVHLLSEKQNLSLQNIRVENTEFKNYFYFDLLSEEEAHPPFSSIWKFEDIITGTTKLKAVNNELLIFKEIIKNLSELIKNEGHFLSMNLRNLFALKEGLTAEIEFKIKQGNEKEILELLKKKVLENIREKEFSVKIEMVDFLEAFNLSFKTKTGGIIKDFFNFMKIENKEEKVFCDTSLPSVKCLKKKIIPIIIGAGKKEKIEERDVIFISKSDFSEIMNLYKKLIKYFCM